MRLNGIKCDQCGLFAPVAERYGVPLPQPPDGWYTLFAEPSHSIEDARHYCSMRCLHAYTSERVTANDIPLKQE